jgi:amidase
MEAAARWESGFTELAPDIHAGKVSPVDLTTELLDRIDRYDGQLHSYVALDRDLALRAAAAAVKDVFFTTDLPTRLGSSIYADWQPPYESTATQRLRDAGAIIVGKLAATEGVYADHHPSIVPPLNPFGAEHWTGTSSSGSGVATTAGLCYGSLATDTGGSIRLPSACCGVVGIKPTWGRVSRHGVLPLAESLDHVGTMARTVADAATLLAAIAGADPADPTASRARVPNYLATMDAGIDGLTIGIDRSYVSRYATDEVVATIDAAIETLSGLGARFVDVVFPDVDAILRGWAIACAVEAAVAHTDTFPARRAEYGERLAALLDRGHRVAATDLARAMHDRRDFTGRVAAMFAPIDLLLVPALPVAGPTLAYMAGLGEDPEAILAIGPFTAPFDVCGYPTITLPCGTSAAGIPVGLQLAAKPFDEGVLVRAGHAYQQRTDWHRRRPALDALRPAEHAA